MSELKTTQQLHADNDISLAWNEYEKCGEVGNYAENLLHAAEFYQTEAKTKEQENRRLTAIATKHATRADELYELMREVYKFGNTIISPALCLAEVDYPMSGQARAANTDWDDIQHRIKLILDKSRIEAEKGDGICN